MSLATAQSVHSIDGGTTFLKSVELYGLAVLSSCFMAGINKFREDTVYTQQTKFKIEGEILCSSYRRWMLIYSFMSRLKSRALW